MTPSEYDALASQYTASIDEARFSLAFLARQAREEHIPFWAERMGNLPKVRRAKRTIEEWARVADFIYTLPRRYNLPWSAYAAAARKCDILEATVIEEALEDAEAEAITIEALQAFLNDAARPEAKAFDLFEELSLLLVRLQNLHEAAESLDGRDTPTLERDATAMLRIVAAVETEQARLVVFGRLPVMEMSEAI